MESVGETDGHCDQQGVVNHDETDASRREMLTRIGRFAYAAPALALLAEPKSVLAYGRGTMPGYGYGRSGPFGLRKKPGYEYGRSGPFGLRNRKK